MSILDTLSNNQVTGDLVDIKRTNPLHLNTEGKRAPLVNSEGISFEDEDDDFMKFKAKYGNWDTARKAF